MRRTTGVRASAVGVIDDTDSENDGPVDAARRWEGIGRPGDNATSDGVYSKWLVMGSVKRLKRGFKEGFLLCRISSGSVCCFAHPSYSDRFTGGGALSATC